MNILIIDAYWYGLCQTSNRKKMANSNHIFFSMRQSLDVEEPITRCTEYDLHRKFMNVSENFVVKKKFELTLINNIHNSEVFFLFISKKALCADTSIKNSKHCQAIKQRIFNFSLSKKLFLNNIVLLNEIPLIN